MKRAPAALGWLTAIALCSAACPREDVELAPSTDARRGRDSSVAEAGVDGAPEEAGASVEGCGGDSYVARGRLELFVLLDDSATMFAPAPSWECLAAGVGCPPDEILWMLPSFWDVAITELKTFLADRRSSGISLALKYFGFECDPAFYARPDVPLGTLPEHRSRMEESLNGHWLGLDTATRPALEGALAFARERAQLPRYDARMVVLLITHSGPDPTDCGDNTVRSLSRVAELGFGGVPSISTYVFLVSPDQALNEVARAGGTEQVLFADLSSPGTLSESLNRVRDQELLALPCEYELPAAFFEDVQDPNLVNLIHDGEPVPRIDGEALCAERAEGWYYDLPTNPSRILTCPSTCENLRRGGSIDVLLRCPTVILI